MPPAAAAPQRSSDRPSSPSTTAARIRQPATNPASSGTSRPRKPNESSPCGSAASTGIDGIGPSSVPAGATEEPAPIAKPGPISQLAAQITRFGRKASCPRVSARPPSASVPSPSYSATTAA
ncbi:hypothetical protein GSU72_14860 [Rathayibacter sp. VKM Ac-2760]|nr:hypothetical protein GSU72_14860 [Rathayibacter sp. VKM Ac-2760]